ncbi:RNA polymerase sigma-54 factor [Silvibacterium sp.]|uniref:RNA polymerase factor sigma-54 n=1 Tax=Silvibacterium sp. TaxID=1964179 RepID=UPI0039E24452
MALLQPKLSLKVAQRQILTPGLMQMVSVLALNKLELKEMINAEITENPILEEIEESVPMLDEVASQEIEHDRAIELRAAESEPDKKTDPFEEIDFGSYFQEYLDPGFRSPNSFEITEAPSIENYLSAPGTLSDHLFWQLGSMNLSAAVRDAAEYIIGNLNEDGYLTATNEELLEGYLREQLSPAGDAALRNGELHAALAALPAPMLDRARTHLEAGLGIVRQLDPIGVGTRDLRECLLVQIDAHRGEYELMSQKQAARQAEATGHAASVPAQRPPAVRDTDTHPEALDLSAGESIPDGKADSKTEYPADPRIELFENAAKIVDKHLTLLQKRDPRELSRAIGRPADAVQQAIDFIRTLDPRPGQRFNRSDARLIEPDVVFVKRGDEYVVVMNEEDLPNLRLNQGYRRMLTQEGAEKEVKDYVKERYRSALQLMRNIEQRKNTILRTCESIVRRQHDFLENGVEALRPMMIKEVAEEIGVHPSTVSRAVSNKYAHTPQGVYELRFFFSEGVNGREGAATPLLLLKRKVKKMIEEEDPRKPLTDDQIASMLQGQGIEVTRRTVAKYREDLRIPSTHQRRVRG